MGVPKQIFCEQRLRPANSTSLLPLVPCRRYRNVNLVIFCLSDILWGQSLRNNCKVCCECGLLWRCTSTQIMTLMMAAVTRAPVESSPWCLSPQRKTDFLGKLGLWKLQQGSHFQAKDTVEALLPLGFWEQCRDSLAIWESTFGSTIWSNTQPSSISVLCWREIPRWQFGWETAHLGQCLSQPIHSYDLLGKWL